MGIEEAEKLARDWVNRGAAEHSEIETEMEQMAAVLLTVLPVVRAAEQLASIDAPREMSLAANAYRVIEHGRREASLIKAIATMHAALEGK